MTCHSIRKLCILVAVIAWVILIMGLITTGLKYSIVKCSVVHCTYASVSLLTRMDSVHSISVQGKELGRSLRVRHTAGMQTLFV